MQFYRALVIDKVEVLPRAHPAVIITVRTDHQVFEVLLGTVGLLAVRALNPYPIRSFLLFSGGSRNAFP